MKNIRKKIFALLLAAALMCGMLTPAFAWIPEQSVLRSPDGVYWFDMTDFGYWSSEGSDSWVEIYSQDGVVWFTLEGLEYYKDTVPAESWQIHVLDGINDGDTYLSPDFGRMWIRFEDGNPDYSGWMDWLDVWPLQSINLQDESQTLYRANESHVILTEPFKDYTHPVSVLYSGLDKLRRYVSEVYFNVSSPSAGSGLLLSTDGINWTDSIPASAWKDTDNFLKNLIGAGISFDPYAGVAYQYAQTYHDNQYTLTRADSPEDCLALVHRTLYLRAENDCMVTLALSCSNGTQCTYGMMSLHGLSMEDEMLIVCSSGTSASFYNPIQIPSGTTASFTDVNMNNIFDSADESDDSITLAPYQVMADESGEAVVHLNAGQTYAFPLYVWAEGQDADAIPGAAGYSRDTYFNLSIQCESDPHEHIYSGMPAWTFADDYSSATATFVCTTCGEELVCDADIEVTNVQEPTCTVDRYIDYEVTVTLNGLRYSETQHNVWIPDTALGHQWSANLVPINEEWHGIVCERCAEVKEIGSAMHRFDGETVRPTCQHGGYTTVTCMDCGYSYVENEQPATDHAFLYYITYPSCETDGKQYGRCSYCGLVEETVLPALGHDYGEWVVTTPATDEHDGVETRTCVRCGESETRSIPSTNTVGIVLSAAETFVHPGDTVDVTVDIAKNPGITGLCLKLSYDPDALTLTNVQTGGLLQSGNCTPGGDLSVVPYIVLWEDGTAHDNYTDTGTVLTLTFTVNEDAVLGATTVTVLTDTFAALDKDICDVLVIVTGACMNVVQHIPGDGDGDGEITLKDVTQISRYLAGGWDVEIDERNADVDGDGRLTLRDIVLIRRYLAGGWNVELK